MILRSEKFKCDFEFTIPIGDVVIAISPEGKTYICELSVGFDFVKPTNEDWDFIQLFNRIERKFKIIAGMEIELAEDEIGNSFILIPNE